MISELQSQDGGPFAEYFGPAIYSYTRKQALEDGFQVEVTETAREAGIRFRVFINRTVWDKYVKVPDGVTCQDEQGRLWDVLWMLRSAIAAGNHGDTILYSLHVRNDNRYMNRPPPLVKLKATCGPVDIDDEAPAITIMLPEED